MNPDRPFAHLLDPVPFYVFLFGGKAGTGKTSAALTGNGLTAHMEMDPRSYARAIAGKPIDRSRVIHTTHHSPTNIKDIGHVTIGQAGGAPSVASRHLEGWLEAYENFIDKYSDALENSKVEQIIWDTETRLWQIHQAGWQQQLQEAQAAANKKEIDRLDPLKFTEPKKRYLANSDAAFTYKKHLILITHLKEEYSNDRATGRWIPDGMKDAPGNADLQLEFSVKNGEPVGTIRKIAGSFAMVGMEIPNPSVPVLINLLDAISLLSEKGIPLPKPLNIQMILRLAEEEAE